MTQSRSKRPSERPGAPGARDNDPRMPDAAGKPSGSAASTAAVGTAAATSAHADEAAEARRAAARRRRHIDEVFGDVLPSTTGDERESGHRGGFTLEHYRSSRPPHWGSKQ